jgi:hypothetical protein
MMPKEDFFSSFAILFSPRVPLSMSCSDMKEWHYGSRSAATAEGPKRLLGFGDRTN